MRLTGLHDLEPRMHCQDLSGEIPRRYSFLVEVEIRQKWRNRVHILHVLTERRQPSLVKMQLGFLLACSIDRAEWLPLLTTVMLGA